MRGRKPYKVDDVYYLIDYDKKRIPEWGDGNVLLESAIRPRVPIKKESPNEGTETSFL